MTKPLFRLIRELDATAGQPAAERLALAEVLRPRILAQPDPLLKARFLLSAALIGDTQAPVAQVIDELLLAYRIFRANERVLDGARALARLSYWYSLGGWNMAAILAGRAALAVPLLPLPERLAQLPPLCAALAHQLRMADAWALLEEVTESLGRRELDNEAALAVDVTKAVLHLVGAVRALRLPSVYTLDLEPGEPDRAAADHHLLQCGIHLGEGERNPLGGRGMPRLRAQWCALMGDEAGLRSGLAPLPEGVPADTLSETTRLYCLGWGLRVLGDPVGALAAQRQALLLHGQRGSAKVLPNILYDIDLCEAALGRVEAAHAALRRYLRERAMQLAEDALMTQSLGLVLRDEQWADATQVPADAHLRVSEPPCLKRVERLLIEHLPRRLPLTSLAEQAGVALRTLQSAARSFRQVTLTDMLRSRVMTEALTRVLHSDLPLKDIGEQLGYHEAASFTRDFKRVHGAAPSVYRRARPPATGGH